MEPVLPFAPDLTGAAGHLAARCTSSCGRRSSTGAWRPALPLPSTRHAGRGAGHRAQHGGRRVRPAGCGGIRRCRGAVRRRSSRMCAGVRSREARSRRCRSKIARLAPFWRTPFMPSIAARELPERSFRLGIRDHRHFPHALWRRLTAQALQQWSKQPFRLCAVAKDCPRCARRSRSTWRSRVRWRARRDDVIVTSGAQQAFDLLARLLVTPGEDARGGGGSGLSAVACGVRRGGRAVGADARRRRRAVRRMPAGTMSQRDQRDAVASVADRRRRCRCGGAWRCWISRGARDAVIIEDDYDGEFRFGGRPLDALQTLDRDGVGVLRRHVLEEPVPGLAQGLRRRAARGRARRWRR